MLIFKIKIVKEKNITARKKVVPICIKCNNKLKLKKEMSNIIMIKHNIAYVCSDCLAESNRYFTEIDESFF